MQIIQESDAGFDAAFEEILRRGKMDIEEVASTVGTILKRIREEGDRALIEDIARFDRWRPDSAQALRIDPEEMRLAYEGLDDALKEALHLAHHRIERFHREQMPKSWMTFESNGTVLGQKVTPMERAGLYIPGGKAAYPSSLLMNAIPASVAGVEEIVVCTPTPDGEINSLLLAAMYLCDIDAAYKVGGASAIGAMAYGTETIPKVDVITGPGNIFVATAKKMVYGEVNIDMIAGPSEIGIIADAEADADRLAIDLLSQAEHDEMASALMITTSYTKAIETKDKIYHYLKTLKREEIARTSIERRGAIIVVDELARAAELMNEIAPEHLELMVQNPFDLLPSIRHAGAIFMGAHTPEAIGDYIAGPNHTLPTGGTARFYSPLGVEHFLKKSSIISMSAEGLRSVAEACALIAEREGLDAHRASVLKRLE